MPPSEERRKRPINRGPNQRTAHTRGTVSFLDPPTRLVTGLRSVCEKLLLAKTRENVPPLKMPEPSEHVTGMTNVFWVALRSQVVYRTDLLDSQLWCKNRFEDCGCQKSFWTTAIYAIGM